MLLLLNAHNEFIFRVNCILVLIAVRMQRAVSSKRKDDAILRCVACLFVSDSIVYMTSYELVSESSRCSECRARFEFILEKHRNELR